MTTTQISAEQRQRLLERLRNGEIRPPEQKPELAIPRTAGGEIPLSCGQQQVWLHSEFASGAPIYNESITIRKRGAFRPALLEASFKRLLSRHEILRTGFAGSVSGMVQRVQDDVRIALPFVDLSHLPTEEAEREALRLASGDARAPFDLEQPPLLRARIVRIAGDEHRIYMTLHHLVFDAISIYQVFLPELVRVYEDLSSGVPPRLPELPIQYGDYARWQQHKVAVGDYADQLEYWRDALREGVPALDIGARSRPAAATWQGGMETFSLSGGLLRNLKAFNAHEGSTLYMTLLASFHLLLYRYSGQEHITTGAAISKRDLEQLQPLMGFLLNTVLVQSRIEPAVSFRAILSQVRDRVLGALANSDVPFDELIRRLAPKRDASRNSVFQVLFSLRASIGDLPEDWSLGELDVHSGATGFDLFVDVIESSEGISGRIVYNSDLFDQAAIALLVRHWETMLAAVITDPEAPVGSVPLLTREEKNKLLACGAGPVVPAGSESIHGLFEEKAREFPNRVALIFGDEKLTFRELSERANQFSRQLAESGVRAGALLAISVERSVEMVIGLLGILKAGAAYLPIDPALPQQRREFLLSDAKPQYCITSRRLTVTECELANPAQYAGLAYVLYTSGSTGIPKGVEVPVSAVVNLLRSMQVQPGFSASDILLAITTLSFDIAALEIFLPLITGGTLVVAPRIAVSDPVKLIEAIRGSGCTVLQGTPAVWRSLLDAGWTGDQRLKALCGGEALPRSLADRLVPVCGELWNLYGPTETTIWSTIDRVGRGDESPSIGRPIDNTQVYIVDRQLQLVPAGHIGELYIGGSGVARGYIGRPELTAERFVPSPFSPGERIYRTGDLARWRSRQLEFIGRADNQVKVRGYRIELGEIEDVLAKAPGVRCVAVKPWRDASGENALVAYVEGRAEISSMREHLARKMPDYMIPSRFVQLDALPLTPNGKVDRKALPEPAPDKAAGTVPAGSRTPTEARMAKIWGTLLNISEPDPAADFFALGGHSLLAAELCRRISVEFGTQLSLAALFDTPTIAALSRQIDAQNRGVRSDKRSLHWVYPGRFLAPLVNRLSDSAHFQGLSLPSNIERSIGDSHTLQDVARLMLGELKAASPEGPYALGGWCVSGILAYEIAVQLEARGDEVDLVVLLGAANPQFYRAISRFERLKSKVRFHWKHLKAIGPAGIPAYVRTLAPYHIRMHNPANANNFSRVLSDLALPYNPTPLGSKVVFFEGEDRPSVADHAAGWRTVLQGEFQAHDVPGNHATALEEPNVAVLAEKLRKCLLG